MLSQPDCLRQPCVWFCLLCYCTDFVIMTDFTFLVPPYPGYPGKEASQIGVHLFVKDLRFDLLITVVASTVHCCRITSTSQSAVSRSTCVRWTWRRQRSSTCWVPTANSRCLNRPPSSESTSLSSGLVLLLLAGLSSRVVSASACGVRGPRFESLLWQLCLSRQLLWYMQSWTRLCTFTAVLRSTQPSTLHGTVKWVSAYRLSNNNNGDDGCGW